ncbi:hypothetical protein ACHAXT_000022 [Thalassiosira profunda]
MNHTTVALALFLAVSLSEAAASTSELQISDGTLSSFQSYDHIEALFGVPAYGDSVSERLYYAESTLCSFDAEDARRGYPLRNYDDEGKQLPWPSPFVLMLDRGECTFVTKVRNAQRHGAAAVIIADSSCLCDAEDAGECVSDPGRACETLQPVMADDGSGADIAIPSVLMFKQDADLVKADAQANIPIRAVMSWPLPVADDRVEYELWTTPTHASSEEFLREFKEAAVALGDRAYFTPQMYIFDGIRSGCQGANGEDSCYNLCTNSGRYCLPDPDDLDRGISGADVVMESLRRMCIWRLYGQEDGVGVPWWDYVNNFSSRCETEELFSNEQCIADAMAATRVIDAGEVEQCMSDSGLEGDAENEILEEQLQAQAKRGVVFLPSMHVNGVAISGAVEFSKAFQAICAGYAPGTAPSICTTCSSCDDLKACISKGGCESNLFVPSPAGADPPQMGDPDELQPSYLHEIPTFTMVLGFPRDVELSALTLRELEDITSAFLQDNFDEASGYVTALQADEIDQRSLESSIEANQTTNETVIGSMQGSGEDLHFIEVSGIVLLREAMDGEATAEFVAKSLGAAFQMRDDLLERIQASSSSDLQSASFVELSASFDVCPNGLRCHHLSRCELLPEEPAADSSMNTSEEAASQNSFPSAGDIAIFVIMGVGLLLTTLIVAYSLKKKRSPPNESEQNAAKKATADTAAAPAAATATAPPRDEEVGLSQKEPNNATTEEEKEEIARPEGEEEFETTQIKTKAVGGAPDSSASPR